MSKSPQYAERWDAIFSGDDGQDIREFFVKVREIARKLDAGADLQDKKFVVAYCSQHEGRVEQKVVYAKDHFSAACDYFGIVPLGCHTLEDMYDYAADMDAYLSVLEI
jgi:hypothetical protein